MLKIASGMNIRTLTSKTNPSFSFSPPEPNSFMARPNAAAKDEAAGPNRRTLEQCCYKAFFKTLPLQGPSGAIGFNSWGLDEKGLRSDDKGLRLCAVPAERLHQISIWGIL